MSPPERLKPPRRGDSNPDPCRPSGRQGRPSRRVIVASNSISMQSNSISRYVVVVVVVILVCKQQARPHLYEHHNAQARSAHFVQAGTGSGAAGKWRAGCGASWASGLGRAHHVS